MFTKPVSVSLDLEIPDPNLSVQVAIKDGLKCYEWQNFKQVRAVDEPVHNVCKGVQVLLKSELLKTQGCFHAPLVRAGIF